MPKLKTHKTVEQIAKKHRLDVSFIQKQLDMGEPIEHEHTKDHELAMDIALQHLDEIPDYYTRLKKMEVDAKKHHKKFKDVKEHCGCEDKAINELEDRLKKLENISYNSVDKLMRHIMKKYDMTAKQLHNSFVDKHDKTPDVWIKNLKEETKSGDEGLHDWFNKSKSSDGKSGWVQLGGKWAGKPCARQPGQTSTPKCGSSKMKRALSKDEEEAARRRKNRLDPNQPEKSGGAKPTNVRTEEMDLQEVKDKPGNLHGWFQDSESKDKKPGWVEVISGEPCAREKGEEDETPKCVSSDKRASMTKSERISAQRRKSAADPNQPEKTNAAKPTYVSTDSPKKKMKEEMDVQEAKDKPGKGSGKKDACYNKVKSRYDVWPSAYASGALVKCRKVGAANWGTKSEATMHEEERYCPLCDKRETRSECSYGGKAWDKVSVKDHEYSMVRSELETLMNAAQRIQKKVGKGEGSLEAWVQSKITKAADYIDTAADYIDSGEMEEAVGYTINPSAHKTAQKREKIRALTTQGIGGEKQVAKAKLGQTTELPKIKEETLVDKIAKEIVIEKCWSGYKRKKGTSEFEKGSCVKAENVTIEDANGNTFAEVIDLIKPEPIKGFKSQIDEATRLQAQTGNVVAVTLSWRGKYYSLKMFFPQTKLPTRKELNDELQKVYPGCVVIYHAISEIQPGQPLIQAFGPQGGSSAKFGPNKNYVKPMGEEVEVDEDWQKVNRQDKTDGLSPAAVKAYRRENPGSKLQTAVTEKKPTGKRAKRRASFCRRMKGMKSKLTSAKTARDPDSNINKALRRWNCN